MLDVILCKNNLHAISRFLCVWEKYAIETFQNIWDILDEGENKVKQMKIPYHVMYMAEKNWSLVMVIVIIFFIE